MSGIYPLLASRPALWLLLWVNIFGTAYGYYWYGWQLRETPPEFLLFVPDSPTASLFFVFVLIAFLKGRNWPLMQALAIVSLFKYGIWAVVMNLLVFIVSGELDWIGLMLMGSHFAMAVEGILYSPFYRMKPRHLIIAAIIILHNEIIDYVFKMMPRYHTLDLYMNEIGYFTFWLSILSIGVGYYFCLRPGRLELPFKSSR
ncbi:DUF1405 domain-containing protein [Bacillus sp. T33-2]|uniref:DUF1405 domain-containing protein n=1 Tax=Bacillus sp. T33-2 TaxID=2054168 RepID=UPI000C75A710|nr:DUF1405 domain-containing protein [Bacillus sp. T33-2]PLR99941.1 DUF1405 domain-containing protein [Bacillus sp. T33-2]